MIEALTIYLIIAIVCGLLLIVMAALGGHGDSGLDTGGGPDVDVGHGDFSGTGISPLSIPILLIFGTMFGCVGGILEALKWDQTALIPVMALIVSAIVTAVTFVIMVKVFVKSQGSTAVGLADLVGLSGIATIRITEKEPGQIVVSTEARGRVTAPAIAKEEIPTNAQIKVIQVVGDSVMVEKI
jgi:membrane-bound ClpP family serine protease